MRWREWCEIGKEHEVNEHSIKTRDGGMAVGGRVVERIVM